MGVGVGDELGDGLDDGEGDELGDGPEEGEGDEVGVGLLIVKVVLTGEYPVAEAVKVGEPAAESS